MRRESANCTFEQFRIRDTFCFRHSAGPLEFAYTLKRPKTCQCCFVSKKKCHTTMLLMASERDAKGMRRECEKDAKEAGSED